MAGMLVLHARATETSKWNASTALPSRAKKCSRARCEDRQEFGSFFFSRLLGIEVSYGNESCIVTFEALFPALRDGGVYLCEDTHTSYFPGYGGGLRQAGLVP